MHSAAKPLRLAACVRVARRSVRVLLALALAASLVGVASCTSRPDRGFYHKLQRGENLYRVGMRYGVPHKVLARVNRIDDPTSLRAGSKIWIPSGAKKKTVRKTATKPKVYAARVNPSQRKAARKEAQREARRASKLAFAWPVKGRLTSSFGRRRGRPHDGIDVGARKGTTIRAAESGKVIHSGRLGDYGNAVIVKHAGSYRTVYAHASRTLVRKGQFVERGQRIALVGSTGRSTGPHLHFEIRRRASPRDPMLYLP